MRQGENRGGREITDGEVGVRAANPFEPFRLTGRAGFCVSGAGNFWRVPRLDMTLFP